MKKSKVLFACALLAGAFFVASCASKGEKVEEKKCQHEKADHKCDSVKMDSCKHAQKDTTVVQ